MRCKALRLTPWLRRTDVRFKSSLAAAFQARYFRHLIAPAWCKSSHRSYATTTSDPLLDIAQHTKLNPVTIFHSRSDDPYYNLAVENYLLKNSDPNSRILFTYVNRPCVVIGRNQNPWLECNIARIQQGLYNYKTGQFEGSADIVRRRSGGGTVVHDPGNLCFSFIVPNDKDFTRDKHALMIVDALNAYVPKNDLAEQDAIYKEHENNIQVNARHDIVLTKPGKTFKVSGSAYKLTRGRALHHGTLLLMTPNAMSSGIAIAQNFQFSEVLSSPARKLGVLDAKGVASVRSRVSNLFDPGAFSFSSTRKEIDPAWVQSLAMDVTTAIASSFRQLYHAGNVQVLEVGINGHSGQCAQDIREDMLQMKSDGWRYCQTPTFTFTHEYAPGYTLSFEVKRGIIEDPKITSSMPHTVRLGSKGNPDLKETTTNNNEAVTIRHAEQWSKLAGKTLHRIDSWPDFLRTAELKAKQDQKDKISELLARIFPKSTTPFVRRRRSNNNTIVEEKRVGEQSDGTTDGLAIRRVTSEGYAEIEEQQQNVIKE